MVLREHNDPLNQSRGIMGPLENATGVQNNRGRLRQRFDLIRKLGQGTYGKVQLGIDKETGQEVAIKTIKKSKIETEADLIRIRREIQIMSSVRHPNIIHIYEVFENREKMVLVMEYAAGGELYDYLNERKILQEDEARRIFRQIASAVYYCHKHNICHRDLKLENILLDEKFNAKIADFGLSNVFDDVNLLKTFCGSPLYASPEIVRGTPYQGPEVDCWSLGVLLYTLVYGAMPFDGSNFKRLVKQISNGDYFEPKKPAEASPLIRIMLTVDPKKRADIRKVCSQPWVNQGFDQECLGIADELATQTPVRLDLLLALANCQGHNQGVIEQPTGDQGAAADAASQPVLGEGADSRKAQPPTKPKRRIQPKSKSKSSPLLELIQDVEEELELPLGHHEGRENLNEDDDACDTLSEISEIQTLAEDFGDSLHKAATTGEVLHKSRAKREKSRVRESKPSGKSSGAPSPQPPPVAEPSKPKKTEIEVQPEPETVSVVAEAAAAPPPEEAPKKVVKKKVVKPKAPEVEKKPEPEEVKALAPVAAPTEKLEPPTPSSSSAPSREVTPLPPTVASSPVKEKSATPDKESSGDSTGSKPKPKLKERSDSVSPTRIERRNSKVISQKTAELIQNLETKVSPSAAPSGSVSDMQQKPPNIKKIVIPCFKVSDAKSKFESKPPRPLTTSVSRSKAAFEAKALQSQSSVEEKSKSSPDSKGTSSDARSSASPEHTKAKPTETPPPPVAEPPPQQLKAEEEPSKDKRPVSPAKKTTPAEPAAAPVVTPPKPEIAETPKPEPKPEVAPVAKPRGPGKIQIPAALAVAATNEVKPVLLDAGKGGPRQAMMIVKGKTSPLPDIRNLSSPPVQTPEANRPSAPVDLVPPASKPCDTSTTACKESITCPAESDTEGTPEPGKNAAPAPPLGPAAAAKQKLLNKIPQPQNKEQAVKKITSVITKIVNSGSAEKGLNSEEGPKKFSTLPRAQKPESEKMIKTEVCFPVVAAPTQERIIPIKFAEDGAGDTTPPTPVAAPSASGSTASVASSRPLAPRTESFRRLDSSGSVFSRQDSSDTESCSVAHPHKLEPIRKCPREFLIPIKLEGSGHTVTPKEDLTSSTVDAAQAGEDDFRMDSRLRSGRFGRQKRFSSLLSDSSFDDEPSVSVSGAASRRTSGAGTGLPPAPSVGHSRSRSQGDEPEVPGASFKRYRSRRHATAAPDMPLDRSDSFSSAEEDEEDAFQVLTAESLFSNLLDRVRNLTRRINRDDPLIAPNWSTDPTTFGLWGTSPLRDFMNRAPSETRSVASSAPGSSFTHRSFSREPSVSMAATGPGGAWRRSLSRDLSGDSDSAGHSPSLNPHSRTQLSRLSSELYETGSARSLPLSSRRSPSSYLSQRSVDGEPSSLSYLHSHSHGSGAATLGTGRVYNRTLSHSGDYNSSPASRTLPLRRSLKTFDRNPQTVPEYDGASMTTSLTGSVGRHSLLDSKFEPSKYLTRLRSISRDRGVSEREPATSRLVGGANHSYYSGEANGWVGGHDAALYHHPASTSSVAASSVSSLSPVSTGIGLDSYAESVMSPTGSFSLRGESPTPSSTSSRLSVQEKMNNYSQYYQSLSQSPFRRLPIASPSQIHSHQPQVGTNGAPCFPTANTVFGVGLSELRGTTSVRPVSISEPLALKVENGKETDEEIEMTSVSHEAQHTPTILSPTNVSSSVTSPSSMSPASQVPSLPSPVAKPVSPLTIAQVSPKCVDEITRKPPIGGSGGTGSSIPRWPAVSVRQHRPLSISSFPEGHQRSSSVSRMMSPPPVEKDTQQGDTTAVVTQKRGRETRATSVERITRLLERKSMPREVSTGPPATPPSNGGGSEVNKKKMEDGGMTQPEPAVEPAKETNGTPEKPSGLKKPKFLQSLEKKWEKFTNGTNSATTSGTAPSVKGDIEQVAVVHEPIVPSPAKGTPLNDERTSPEHQTGGTSEENSSHEEKINESVLLRRALSPEKKVTKTSRMAAGTVNFMLGKFKRMESTPPQESSATASKIPTGRPPVGGANPPNTLVSRFGRRVQSAYVGATSDSVLTLAAKETARSDNTSQESGLIKSAVMAQAKRRPRVEIKKDGPSAQPPPAPSKEPEQPPVPTVNGTSQKEKPPSESLIPRLGDGKITEARPKSPLPEIQIEEDPPNTLPVANENLEATLPTMDLSMLSPISVPESVNDSSYRSEDDEGTTSEQHASSTGGGSEEKDDESVSERILRKSFYNRFNSGNRRSASFTPASSLRVANAANSNHQTRPAISHSSVSNGNRLSGGESTHGQSMSHHPFHRPTSPGASTVASKDSSELSSHGRSPSPYHWSAGLNKYNPNPLFKELITDDYKSTDVGKKTEYSRRITSKLSKLLREIESDLNSCQLTKTSCGGDDDDGESSSLLLGGDEQTQGSTNRRHVHRVKSPLPASAAGKNHLQPVAVNSPVPNAKANHDEN